MVATQATELWDVIGSYLGAEDLELDDLEISGSDRGRLIRVIVDAEGGVGVDRLAETSRAVSRMLDAHDPFDGAYTLEVTSPGLERKLRRPRHYEKSIGKLVTVKHRTESGATERHRGVLTAADDQGCVVEVDGEAHRLAYADVTSAQTVFEWKAKPKPGQKSG